MASQVHITLEMVTPEGARLTEEVSSFTVPGVDGELGILPGHRPLLVALKTGILGYQKDGDLERVVVGSGFVEFSEDHAVILTERFIRKADVDAVTVRLDLKEADEAIQAFDGDPASAEYASLVSRELWAAAQLELHGDPPPPIVRSLAEFEAQPVEKYGPADEPTAEAAPEAPPAGGHE